jgi:hypothetical protein
MMSGEAMTRSRIAIAMARRLRERWRQAIRRFR